MFARASNGAPVALRRAAAASLRRRSAPTTGQRALPALFPSKPRLPPSSSAAAAAGYRTSAPLALPLQDPEGPKTKQAKVKRKEKRSAAAAKAAASKKGGRDSTVELLARAYDAVPEGPPEPSEEEAARRYAIGNAYVRGMFEWHNELEHDLACKIKLKRHAIKMLPRENGWKEEAMKIDLDAPPMHRHIPTDYPPVKDFDPTPFLQDEED